MANHVRAQRDGFGSFLGVLTFLGGVALMLVVFRLAYGMFTTPAHEALGVLPGKAIDLNTVGPNFAKIIIQILLLLVMGVVASLVANRGISLYTASRGHRVAAEVVVAEPQG